MRLSKLATASVPLRDSVKAIALVVVLVGSIGFFTMYNGHAPRLSPWLWGGTLVWIWGLTVLQGIRFGRAVFSWQWVALLLGYTLFVGGQLWAHPPAVVSWLSNSGMLMALAGMLSPYVEFGRRREDVSKKAQDETV